MQLTRKFGQTDPFQVFQTKKIVLAVHGPGRQKNVLLNFQNVKMLWPLAIEMRS